MKIGLFFIVMIVVATILSWLWFRKRVRGRSAVAAALRDRPDLHHFSPELAAKVLGPKLGKKPLFVLNRLSSWGAVYLVDQLIVDRESEGEKTLELRCAVIYNDLRPPDFVFRKRDLGERIPLLSMRLGGMPEVRTESGTLPGGWILLADDDEALRRLFATGLAHALAVDGAVEFESSQGRIHFVCAGAESLEPSDLLAFLDRGTRIGTVVAEALAAAGLAAAP
jgi:hypothetical protein